MPGSAVVGAQEVPGGQMIVATVASVRDRIQETARLFDPHGSPLITLEGGENGSVQKDMQKQSAAQQVPAQLSSFQPGLRCGATCTERPKEPVSGKVSGTPTTKTHGSITLEDRVLSSDPPAARYGRLSMSGMSAGVTMATTDGPVAPLPGGPVPIRAEVRAPHPAELLMLQVPSQCILEAGAATSRDQAHGAIGSVAR